MAQLTNRYSIKTVSIKLEAINGRRKEPHDHFLRQSGRHASHICVGHTSALRVVEGVLKPTPSYLPASLSTLSLGSTRPLRCPE
jgi:hypothetical protein